MAGIILAVGGAGNPTVNGTSPDLNKQYRTYAREVRLPETRRETRRTVSAATLAANARKSDSGLVNKKAARRLK